MLVRMLLDYLSFKTYSMFIIDKIVNKLLDVQIFVFLVSHFLMFYFLTTVIYRTTLKLVQLIIMTKDNLFPLFLKIELHKMAFMLKVNLSRYVFRIKM